MMLYSAKWPEYARQWDSMEPLANRDAEFTRDAQVAIANKAIYEQITANTDVPWPLIAVIHRREGNADFSTYLGNGQPLAKRTTIVPIGRGPFKGDDAFVRGAIDALTIQGMTKVIDWRLEKMLFWEEKFNGEGYHNRGLPSPYIFGGTTIQQPGKFIRDHVFDPRITDPQPGCAPILKKIAELDKSVVYVRETPSTKSDPTPEPVVPTRPKPETVKWHGFGFYGMWGAAGTDVAEHQFSLRVRDLGVDIGGSPYNDQEATAKIAEINHIPDNEGVLLWGTSLGACNIAMIANLVKRRIDGMWGFQASYYGVRGYPINDNVRFAHIIYSYNPIPLPLLGAYTWPKGTIDTARYVKTPHHIAHPGDYDVGDQNTFLAEMKRIIYGE